MKYICIFFLILNLFALVGPVNSKSSNTNGPSQIIFVDVTALGINDGSSWINAYVNLQDALAASVAGDELWVAQGLYRPDLGIGFTQGDVEASFAMKNNVAIYGGFLGNEALLEQRDWTTNLTILSGNLFGTASKHILRNTNIDTTAILDGFTIRDAIAIGGGVGGVESFSGAGMLIDNASPTIVNSTFINNKAINGSAFYSTGGNPIFINCLFSFNIGANGGSAIIYGTSQDTFINSQFIGNVVPFPNTGAVFHKFNGGSVKVINGYFSANSGKSGVGTFSGATGDFTNTSFTGNVGTDAGVVQSIGSTVNFENSILWNNSGLNGELLVSGGSVTLNHSIIKDDIEDGLINLPPGVVDGGNNLDANPGFTSGFVFPNSSPAVDVGNNGAVDLVGITTDISGNPRNINGVVDIGAFESDGSPPTAVCQDINAPLNLTGETSFVPEDIDGGSFDNIAITGFSTIPSVLFCSDIGPNQITLTVTDGGTNTDSCEATVTVEDNLAPNIEVGDQLAYFDLASGFVLPGYNDFFTVLDNCDVNPVITQSPVIGTLITEETDTMITLSVIDSKGNSEDYEFTLTTRAYDQHLTGEANLTCAADVSLTLNTSVANQLYYLVNETTVDVIGIEQLGTGGPLDFQTGMINSPLNDYHVFEAGPSFALTFNGVDESVEVSSPNVLPIGSEPRTIELVFKTSQLTDARLFHYGTMNAHEFFTLDIVNGHIEYGSSAPNIPLLTPFVADGLWHHIALVMDGQLASMYVDGNLTHTITTPDSSNISNDLILARTLFNDKFFNGEMAAVRIWDRPLDSAEIYHARLNLFDDDQPDLVLYYPFFENSGTILTDVINSQSGSLINMDTSNWISGTAGGMGAIVSNVHSITYNSELFVDFTALGTGNGCDWSNAYNSIITAVNASIANGSIYVAAGTYLEGAEIVITKPLVIKGGYPNGGGEQDIVNNPTYINGANSHRVMSYRNSVGPLELEGLVIEAGGGVAIGAGVVSDSNIIGRRLTVRNNHASHTGGGLWVSGPLKLINSQITLNTVNSTINFTAGGGIYGNSEVILINSQVHQNMATSNSVAIGGGVGMDGLDPTLLFVNSSITENSAITSPGGSAAVGGIYSVNLIDGISLHNSLLWNNRKSTDGGNTYIASEYDDSITLVTSHSLIKDQYLNDAMNTNNVDATVPGFDPMFADELTGDYRLLTGSPLIDVANNSLLPLDEFDLDGDGDVAEILSRDFDLLPRIYNATVDVGPFENQPASYALGGVVSGLLDGNYLVLDNNGTDDKTIVNNGPYQFSDPVYISQPYSVSVELQPNDPIQPCVVSDAMGVMGSIDVSDVDVDCEMGSDLIFRDGF